MKTDLLTVMMAVTDERLSDINVEFSDESAACVIMASAGYPSSYEKGFEIDIPSEIEDYVYVAGAALKDGKLVTSGGRVLGVTAVAKTLDKAIEKAYERVSLVSFENAFSRSDIGQKALKALMEEK
jgi:phosphoribosylamine--glycine ligase